MLKENVCSNEHVKRIIFKMQNEKIRASWEDEYIDETYHDNYHDSYGDVYRDTYNDTSYSDNW